MPARSSAAVSRRSAVARCTIRKARRAPVSPARPLVRTTPSVADLERPLGVRFRGCARRAPAATRGAGSWPSAPAGGGIVERIWLEHYPKGVPADIDINEYASLRDVFDESVAKYSARPAYTCMGKTITFGELDTLSTAFAGWLQAKGCGKGARVALMMPNILQYPVCLFGILRAGCTVVNVNPLYTARELEHQLNDSGAEICAHTLAEVVGKTKVRELVVTSIGELLGFKGLIVDFVLRHVKKMVPAFRLPGSVRLSAALAAGRGKKLERVPLGHDDIAF